MLRETLEREDRERFLALTLPERIAACYAAGRLQLALFARQQGLELDEARVQWERNKQLGRTPCSFLDDP